MTVLLWSLGLQREVDGSCRLHAITLCSAMMVVPWAGGLGVSHFDARPCGLMGRSLVNILAFHSFTLSVSFCMPLHAVVPLWRLHLVIQLIHKKCSCYWGFLLIKTQARHISSTCQPKIKNLTFIWPEIRLDGVQLKKSLLYGLVLAGGSWHLVCVINK